jgi:PilZ domain
MREPEIAPKWESAAPANAGGMQEVRCAVRFPLTLPVLLQAGSGEFPALTRNISASGVLFELERHLDKGAQICYSLRMPGPVLGTAQDVLVHCTGRVVRCSLSQKQYLAAATIDDYRFAEH